MPRDPHQLIYYPHIGRTKSWLQLADGSQFSKGSSVKRRNGQACEGAFGEIHHLKPIALHSKQITPFILKTEKKSKARKAYKLKSTFENEIEILDHLDIQYYFNKGSYYSPDHIVMPYEDKIQLFDFCQDQTDIKIINAFLSSALAIQELHQKKVIHLDIKSDNILVDRKTGEATIIDYGRARFINKPCQEKSLDNATYLPSELKRKNIQAHTSMDIFSFGQMIQFTIRRISMHEDIRASLKFLVKKTSSSNASKRANIQELIDDLHSIQKYQETCNKPNHLSSDGESTKKILSRFIQSRINNMPVSTSSTNKLSSYKALLKDMKTAEYNDRDINQWIKRCASISTMRQHDKKDRFLNFFSLGLLSLSSQLSPNSWKEWISLRKTLPKISQTMHDVASHVYSTNLK